MESNMLSAHIIFSFMTIPKLEVNIRCPQKNLKKSRLGRHANMEKFTKLIEHKCDKFRHEILGMREYVYSTNSIVTHCFQWT